jgi:hypothetical protein
MQKPISEHIHCNKSEQKHGKCITMRYSWKNWENTRKAWERGNKFFP